MPTGNALMACTGLRSGSLGNENVGNGATLVLCEPTTRSRPSASTSVIEGISGALVRSMDLPNMAKVSFLLTTGSRGSGDLTIGSRDRALGNSLPFDFARSSSGSKCSAPGVLAVAFAFSRDTVRRWVLGIAATPTALGNKIEARVPLGEEVGAGDGVVCLLVVRDGVVSKGWYALGCNRVGVDALSTSSGVLALYAIGRKYSAGKAGIGLSARSEADQTGESGIHWLTVRLYILEVLLGTVGDASRDDASLEYTEGVSPKEDRLGLSGGGGRGFPSSTGGVLLMNSWKGITVCCSPLEYGLDELAVLAGACFRVGGIVCSIPLNDGFDEGAFKRIGLSGTLGTSSCGMSGSFQSAVSP